jgi:hypothetical protein
MFSICHPADIDNLFDLVPSPLNHIWSYRCDGCCNSTPYLPGIPTLSTIDNVLDASLQNEVHRGKIWVSVRSEIWPAPPNVGAWEVLIQSFAHRLVKMRRCSVLHENDHVSLSKSSVCGKKIFMHTTVSTSNNGSLRKIERA